ncbi:condensation domain-containing protein [Streptomyces sp. TLI_146]|uniref:condensation domain-containing protein n=1 Tax=Streptomyces sp. TLI_146 TaxID=1938858 RepID=UPI000CA95022|nr:condensation domain-containing protein [Streptomyces sp. TLI_146]PKV89776.1 condensation domain-containing protein [Streptomyces sp. TLI_146]
MAEFVRYRTPLGGGRAVTAPATCAQRHIWNLIQRQLPDAAFYDICYWVALPGHGAAQDLLDVFAELLRRHESLRTSFHRGADGSLVQQVMDSAEFETEVWTLTPDEDRDSVLDTWQRRMRHTPFEAAQAPLIRFMVIVADGSPVLAAYCVSHLVVDLTSLRLLADEVTALLDARAAGRPLPPAVPARQPVEQAQLENSPRGRALQARARAYWCRQLAGAPATLFPPRNGAGGSLAAPVRYSAAMESRAVALAVPLLARRWRVSTSVVLLTVVAQLLGRRAGTPSCTLRLLAANRSDPELRGTIGNLHSEVAVTIGLEGERIEDIARRAFAECTAAYANGLYDPDEVADLIASAHGPGVPVDLSYCFNDVRLEHALPPEVEGGAAVSGAALRAAMADTVVAPDEFEEGETFFLVIDDEIPGRIRLVLNADHRALTPSQVHGFLYDVERSLVEYVEGAGQRAMEERGAAAGGLGGRSLL